ncbi:MAG: hypothetical protein AB7D39_20550 [Pseudodesulfovibrio sp.]|uniref:hypothetical protein n=1 Tax=Pseudodesulfovibrio sp. TaxID=2035812 RepID=UPI003D0CD320
MSILSTLLFYFNRNGSAWKNGVFPSPWDGDRESIFGYVRKHSRNGEQPLGEAGATLPDDGLFYSGKKLRWGAGALDGAFGHHVGKGEQDNRAGAIHRCLGRVLGKPSKRNVTELYEELLAADDPNVADELLDAVSRDEGVDFKRLVIFFHWLVTNSPDRCPVKIGIALLGMFQGNALSELFLTFGCHEEFTLYAVVALRNSLGNAERELWELARKVDGWGRIQIVERLAGTRDEEIRGWMLREGYRNSIMYEYLAHACATTGDLAKALDAPDPDEPLLDGAGELLEALIIGGPAQDMRDYDDGGRATLKYITHLRGRDLTLAQFSPIDAIHRFISDQRDWSELEGKGWSKAARAAIAEGIDEILARTDWQARAVAEMEKTLTEDSPAFSIAVQVAKAVGVDVWEYYYSRQAAGIGSQWYQLMRTEDAGRIDKVVSLAERLIPLEEVATGPACELGLGPEFEHHSAVDFIVQDLGKFPGKGWPLIKAALKSPVVRNRNMSIRALERWGREQWPEGAVSEIERALAIEPEEKVKARLRALLLLESV